MRKTRRGYIDEELWKFLGHLSIELGCTKKESSKRLADYLQSEGNFIKHHMKNKPRRRKEFDFKF